MRYDLDYFGKDSFDDEENYFEEEEEFWGDDIRCWSCGKGMSYEQHMHNDGFCPHCNNEIDLEEDE